MKYLKKFNEELKSQTYLSASRKLKKLGNPSSLRRAEELKNWAGKVEWKENIVRWEKNIKDYSKYGVFKLNVNSKKGNFNDDFYLSLHFDSDMFIDNYDDDKSEGDGENFKTKIYLGTGIIPKNKEVLDKCVANMPFESSGIDAFCNGFFWGFWITINIEIINGNRFEFLDINVSTYDDEDTGTINLTSGAAQKLKNLLIELFGNKEFNYPSSYTTTNSEYENLTNSLIKSGVSSDYGLTLDDIAEYIKEYPKHKLMN
jgi:hypothetical protein